MKKRKPVIYAFIDASNLFYGGEKSLGWKIDYKKLIRYIKKQYEVSKVYYYGGVETDGFDYSVLDKKPLEEKEQPEKLDNWLAAILETSVN